MSLKNLIPFSTKVQARLALKNLKGIDPKFAHLQTLQGPKVYVFLAADYGNLGDVAISYAQEKFLSLHLPEFNVVDVPISKTIEGIHAIKKTIGSEDIITTVGGGNFGDRYEQIEYYRQLVIQSFPKNKIVSFPQTIEFSENESGKKALEKVKKIYQRHPNLVLGAREKRSFSEMKQDFPKNTVTLSPDVVMSLDERNPEIPRSGVVLCLRDDGEKKLSKSEETQILETIENTFPNPKRYDTHIGRGNLTMEERIGELEKIWSCFRSAELVVTDRLHGMIFCYITGTPCLVFQNSNHKILSSHAWIAFSPRIRILTEVNSISVEKAIAELRNNVDKPDFYRDLTPEYKDFIFALTPH